MRQVVIGKPVRTPIGAFSGALEPLRATALGSIAIRNAVARAGVEPSQVDEVIMGNVLSAGLGQAPARQAAIGAGLPETVGATTINKVCGSSLKAVMMACQAIQSEQADVIVAGGMESMSRAPYLLETARSGYRLGHAQMIDSIIRDGLWDAYGDRHMGQCSELCASKYQFSREEQDDFAVQSCQRAIKAQQEGWFREEIVDVEVPAKPHPRVVQEDEGPKRFNEDKLRKLRPAFQDDGTITAGNASSINDGAAAMVLCSEEKAGLMGVTPIARILGYTQSAVPPEWFTIAPIAAMQSLFKKLGMDWRDQGKAIDLYEVNEAFAVVAMAAIKELNLDPFRVNVRGGAVTLGHPIGASGARILTTLLHALKQTGGKRGIASICIGGGEGIALAVEMIQ